MIHLLKKTFFIVALLTLSLGAALTLNAEPIPMAKIVIYTKSTCPYCVKAKALLNRKHVKFEEIDVSKDDSLRESLVEKAEGRKTVPQIFIDNKPIGGCDDLYALDKAGELDKLLKK